MYNNPFSFMTLKFISKNKNPNTGQNKITTGRAVACTQPFWI